VAEKEKPQWTYQGETGYMPLVGHVRELSGMVLHEEFREGISLREPAMCRFSTPASGDFRWRSGSEDFGRTAHRTKPE
jgi:hypothetical protein